MSYHDYRITPEQLRKLQQPTFYLPPGYKMTPRMQAILDAHKDAKVHRIWGGK